MSTRERRATKNLPWDEWLTIHFGNTPHGGETHLIGFPRKPDGHYIQGAFFAKGYGPDGRVTQPSIAEELDARGYDLTTLEFRIKRKATP